MLDGTTAAALASAQSQLSEEEYNHILNVQVRWPNPGHHVGTGEREGKGGGEGGGGNEPDRVWHST